MALPRDAWRGRARARLGGGRGSLFPQHGAKLTDWVRDQGQPSIYRELLGVATGSPRRCRGERARPAQRRVRRRAPGVRRAHRGRAVEEPLCRMDHRGFADRDRKALYAEIARANDRPEWEAEIRATFARVWVEEVAAGTWYQANGSWVQK